MIRRPPRSTLFPTRRSSDLWRLLGYSGNSELAIKVLNAIAGAACGFALYRFVLRLRSEEHTSELQSRQYLVCRLLLEKIHDNTHSSYHTYSHSYSSVSNLSL